MVVEAASVRTVVVVTVAAMVVGRGIDDSGDSGKF